MLKTEREKSIGYQLSYTENLHRNILHKRLNKSNLDITPEQLVILALLSEQSNGISMQTISEKIHRDNSAITRTMDSLEKKGYAIRSFTQTDRRKKLILITEEGKELLNKAKNIAQQHVKDAAKGLSEKEKESFFETLEKIQNNLIKINL